MFNLVKFGIPGLLGVGSAGMVGSNWVFKKETVLLIESNNNEDWDIKVKELFRKIRDGNTNLKTQIAGTGDHRESLEGDNGHGSFSDPVKARGALRAWCQSKKDSDEQTVEELCKEKQWVGWLFGNK